MRQNIDLGNLLQFQIDKDITYLYKRFLEELEALKTAQAVTLEKLEKELPTQYHSLLRTSHFFDEREYAFRRKRVLDAGNETKRNIAQQLSQISVVLNTSNSHV